MVATTSEVQAKPASGAECLTFGRRCIACPMQYKSDVSDLLGKVRQRNIAVVIAPHNAPSQGGDLDHQIPVNSVFRVYLHPSGQTNPPINQRQSSHGSAPRMRCSIFRAKRAWRRDGRRTLRAFGFGNAVARRAASARDRFFADFLK